MAAPIHEDSIEIPDGVRVIFHTKHPYVAITVKVFLNGQLLRDDEFILLGAKRVQMVHVPLTGDRLTFFYVPAI